MKQKMISFRVVSAKAAGRATMTEDGGLASQYKMLHEVVLQNGRHQDAYYFVHKANADRFLALY